MDQSLTFTPLEETISFYTRNDFAIINELLLANYEAVWRAAWVAYNDNQGILTEYENGCRRIEGIYDVKWMNALKKRLISQMDYLAKEKILTFAKQDISNILHAMQPASRELLLYRTAWIDPEYDTCGAYPFSTQYKALELRIGSRLDIKTFVSSSLTPYRENEATGNDFYRYQIYVPKGVPILELDQFCTHNEVGEVLLPPMRCMVTNILQRQNGFCKGILCLNVLEQLDVQMIHEFIQKILVIHSES